ncbi:MAG: branched-chain amino acid ABC transporter permease [Pirellulales bacterium]
MNVPWRRWLRLEWITLGVLLLLPLLVPPNRQSNFPGYGTLVDIASRAPEIFIFAILALGLHVVVGYAGLLHLGIAAFFGIGAYVTGVLTVPAYPFQVGFLLSLAAATAAAGLAGVVLGAPTLRLRGDYLALVTLGFGEVVRYSLQNLEEITAGTRALNPIPPPRLPTMLGVTDVDWAIDYRYFYFLALGFLVLIVCLLLNLEKSRLGRAWEALREDELAATCMGIDASRVKLSAFAVGAAIAGLAGCLYATQQTSTTQPDSFDFNRSIVILCCLILGGLGSIRGTLLGTFLLIGFDNILTPMISSWIQQSGFNPSGNRWLLFSSWRLMLFGLALILTMRFRPAGLLPAQRAKAEAAQS